MDNTVNLCHIFYRNTEMCLLSSLGDNGENSASRVLLK